MNIIFFITCLAFIPSEIFSQSYFPAKVEDIYIYNQFQSVNGSVTSNSISTFTCDPVSFSGKEYLTFFTSFYRYDSLTNTLKVYINNTEKLALDLNRINGKDTLFYDYAAQGLDFTYNVSSKYFLGRLRKFLIISCSHSYSYPQVPIYYYSFSVSFKFVEDIGEVEKWHVTSRKEDPWSAVISTATYRNMISLLREDSLYNLFSSPQVSLYLQTPEIVRLTWTNLPWVDFYQVLRRQPLDTAFSVIAQVSNNAVSYMDTITAGNTYYYMLRPFRAIYFAFPDTMVVNGVTDVPDIREIISFGMEQNYPNPFNPYTIIGYSVPAHSEVSLIVYDALGREVRKLINESKDAGKYEVNFNSEGLASGIYFYTLRAGDRVTSRKMILLK